MVYQMIGVYGMGDGIAQLAFPQENGGEGFPQERPYSDATAEEMDLEAKKMVESAYQRTLEVVEAKKEQIKLVAELLVEKETIKHDDLGSLTGARPFKAHKSYLELISANEDAIKQKLDDSKDTADAGETNANVDADPAGGDKDGEDAANQKEEEGSVTAEAGEDKAASGSKEP